jgi:hypothetical protein
MLRAGTATAGASEGRFCDGPKAPPLRPVRVSSDCKRRRGDELLPRGKRAIQVGCSASLKLPAHDSNDNCSGPFNVEQLDGPSWMTGRWRRDPQSGHRAQRHQAGLTEEEVVPARRRAAPTAIVRLSKPLEFPLECGQTKRASSRLWRKSFKVMVLTLLVHELGT